jgi:hypothetical protein
MAGRHHWPADITGRLEQPKGNLNAGPDLGKALRPQLTDRHPFELALFKTGHQIAQGHGVFL